MHSFELVEDKSGVSINTHLSETEEDANTFFLETLGYSLSNKEDTEEVKEYTLSSEEEVREFCSTFNIHAQVEALSMLGYSVFKN